MTSDAEDGGATVVAEAPDIGQARIWIDALRNDGIRATYFERGPSGAVPPTSTCASRGKFRKF